MEWLVPKIWLLGCAGLFAAGASLCTLAILGVHEVEKAMEGVLDSDDDD